MQKMDTRWVTGALMLALFLILALPLAAQDAAPTVTPDAPIVISVEPPPAQAVSAWPV